jgi:hypothetical protein
MTFVTNRPGSFSPARDEAPRHLPELGKAPVEARDLPLGVHDEDTVRGRVERRLEQGELSFDSPGVVFGAWFHGEPSGGRNGLPAF